ncbi:MFS transporter [Fructobacillus ficulneus]|uniref:Major facilitator superfamily permease n=1 Tax=Fructobacillus ficulneus TaxID=157463 RepID=A0A0K8MI17_9LACO|nr:MFS transporter [Fructobacillus ficulneus]GAP00201.1 major facilitator superfamily permease [Fructobacillus ficulneus]
MTDNQSEINWKRNVWIVWFAVFMTGVAFSEILPFMSLYIDTLGHFSKTELTFYSGAAFAVNFLVSAIVSPIWGKIADKKGRKLMMMRAALGLAITLFLMGFTQNVWELLALRATQGALGGFVSNANALVATQTPKDHVGRSLGIVVTGFTGGQLIGPLFGGAMAEVVSYQTLFHLTGFILLIVFFFIWFLIEERPMAAPKVSETGTPITWKTLPKKSLLVSIFITTMLIQTVNMSINPIVSLFVREVVHNGHNVTFIAGVVAAMPGLATVIFAPVFGRLGDRIGTKYMIQVGFLIAILAFVPTAFVTSVVMLVALRFVVGISDSTMLPAIQSLLTRAAPEGMVSRIFSYNQSFQSIGSVMGPMLGVAIASVFDYRAIFIISAIIVAANSLLFYFNVNRKYDLN